MIHNLRSATCGKIRVIIPAYKEKSFIQVCLNKIIQELSEFPDAEVVIISYKSEFTLLCNNKIRIVDLRIPLNAGEARNLGTENAGENILVFIDADVLVETGAIKKIVEPILTGKADATVGNYSKDIIGSNFFQNYKKTYINAAYSHAGYIENEFWTAFSAIKATTFRQVNGFSDKFKLKGGEDTEIGIRLTKNQNKIYAVADACGKHLKNYNFTSLIKNDFDKGTRTVMLSLKQKVKLNHNRHAKRTDQLAVATACLSLAAAMLIFINSLLSLVVPVLLSGYFFTRKNFFIACYKNGLWFFIRSFFTAFVLDIVRAYALINGVIKYHVAKFFKLQFLEKQVLVHPSHSS